MAAVWYRFRAEMRTRWIATLGLAVIVGLAGGVVFTALAGARRTDTAYDRMVDEARSWDVLVLPDSGNDSALDPDEVARLPMVESFGYFPAIAVVPAGAENIEELFGSPVAFTGPDRTAFFEIGRPNVLEGRMPDPDEPGEVLVDPLAAEQLGVGVGDRLRTVVVTDDEIDAMEADPEVGFPAYQRGELGKPLELSVTGIGITHDALVVDEGFDLPLLVVTPALYEREPDALFGFWGGMVRLEDGAAAEADFRKAVEGLVPDETIEFQSSARIAETVDRAVRPYVIALELFALAIAVTGLFVIGQTLARQRFLEAADGISLIPIGFTRVQVLAVAALRAALVAVGGAVLATALAVAASPLMPIGPARHAEPDRGLVLDRVVLGAGALALVIVVSLLGILPAWRLARTRMGPGGFDPRGAGGLSRVPGALARAGAAPVAVTGVRFALEPGRGRTAVPTRTTMVGAIGAVVTVAAALTFAASLDHLLATPRLYGVNHDARLAASVSNEEQFAEAAGLIERNLEANADVDAWSRADLGRVELDGRTVPAIGIETIKGSVVPTIVRGRGPRADDEVALGRRTLERLDVQVGGTVIGTRGTTTRELDVVGRVVLPGAGNYAGGDKTALGDGALLTRDGLALLSPGFLGSNFLVRFDAGVDPDSARRELGREFIPVGIEVAGVEQPADIVDYERVRATPIVLAGMLAVLGVATVAHALVTTVRRRRRDLAVLKTLGFTRPQVSGAVAWQATTIACIALVVGLPIGIAAGRFAWALLAESVGTVAEPVTPLLVVLLAIPAVVVVTNLVAAAPGWLAGRTRPGASLRSE